MKSVRPSWTGPYKKEAEIKLSALLVDAYMSGAFGRVKTSRRKIAASSTNRGKQYGALLAMYRVLIGYKELELIDDDMSAESNDEKRLVVKRKRSGLRMLFSIFDSAFDGAFPDIALRRRLRQRRLNWSRALAYAWWRKIEPEDFLDAILKAGGIEKAASLPRPKEDK